MKKNNLASNISRNNELFLNLINTFGEVSAKSSIWAKIKNYFYSRFATSDLDLAGWEDLESKPRRHQSDSSMSRSRIDYRNLIDRK